MKRLLFAWWVFSGLGWAAPAVASPIVEPPGAEEKPGVALWIEPLLALPTAALSMISYNGYLLLPLGLTVPLGPRQEWVLEVTPLYHRDADCDGSCTSRAVSLALGMSWRVSPGRSSGGVFIQPKLVGVLAREDVSVYHWETGTHDSWSATGRQLSVGLDVGYRFPSKHLVLEFILGGSVGRGWNVPTSSSSLFTAFLSGSAAGGTTRWVWDINPNLIRIGGRF